MTRIAERKTAMRAETSAVYRGRPLMVLIGPYEVVTRQKGRRACFSVPWQAVHELGMKLLAMENRRLKQERRKR